MTEHASNVTSHEHSVGMGCCVASASPRLEILLLGTCCRCVVAFFFFFLIPSSTHTGTHRPLRGNNTKFHHDRICFEVIPTASNTRADLLNPEIQPQLLPCDNLNATFLPHKEKREKHFVHECVLVCLCACVRASRRLATR